MKHTLLLLTLILLAAGCASVTSEAVLPPGASIGSIAADNSVAPAAGLAIVRAAPTAVAVQNSASSLAIVLGGEFDNGGMWVWDDIANLLGTYSQFEAYITVDVGGQDYPGVPLAYLLDYAQLQSAAGTMTVYTRDGGQFFYSVADLNACPDCLIARAPDNSIALILTYPAFEVVSHVMRLEAYSNTQTMTTSMSPPDTTTIALDGQFGNGGYWTWEQITGLVGPDALQTVVVGESEVTGVPLNHLLSYAGLVDAATRVFFYDRNGQEVAYAASALTQCSGCLLVLEADDTISLLLPAHPFVLPALMRIEAY